jgi:hypothetical protein
MATISDTFLKPDGTALTSQTVKFKTYGGPWFRGSGVTSGGIVTTVTNASTGAISVTLNQGVYTIEWRASGAMGAVWSSGLIGVPAGSGTFKLASLLISDQESNMASMGYYTTVADVQVDNARYDLIWISGTETNLTYGWYEAKGDVATHDGETYIENAAGVIYTRRP